MVKLHKVLPDDGGGSSSRQRLFLAATADCLATSGYASRKGYRRKLTRAKVLRMLTPRRAEVGPEEIGDGPGDKGTSSATSGSVTSGGSYENGDNSKEFLSTGRTGRRNALPNILGRHAETGFSDLSDRFEELSTHTDHSTKSGQDPNIPSTSKQHG